MNPIKIENQADCPVTVYTTDEFGNVQYSKDIPAHGVEVINQPNTLLKATLVSK